MEMVNTKVNTANINATSLMLMPGTIEIESHHYLTIDKYDFIRDWRKTLPCKGSNGLLSVFGVKGLAFRGWGLDKRIGRIV